MLKVYDCSNSSERPTTRGFGGSVTNEFVAELHIKSRQHNVLFINDKHRADVIFTNDIFPRWACQKSQIRVKRADGIFWQKILQPRNIPSILAIAQAHTTIFISNYSKAAYEALYSSANTRQFVIHHWMRPPGQFPKHTLQNARPVNLLAMATNWNRPEKRFSALRQFARLFPSTKILLVGIPPQEDIPENIYPCGYLDTTSPRFLSLAASCDAFLNLTCKDAATKTVCVATNLGLPTLYSCSGGVGELVGSFGHGIYEYDKIEILDEVPQLQDQHILEGYDIFCKQYQLLHERIAKTDVKEIYEAKISAYFEAIKKTCNAN